MKNIAKISAALIIIAMLLSLIACGASDKGGSNASPLIGTWENSEYGTAYTFNDDGAGTLTGEGYSMTLTYVDNDSTVDVTYNGGSEVQTLNYSIKDNVLTLEGIEYTKK